ncbi:MAG: hypothetical protein FWB91_06610 [Defluviitaleaceae bacterium]|nr:hypothetical protein [Defluviitaleaceae bacterium]
MSTRVTIKLGEHEYQAKWGYRAQELLAQVYKKPYNEVAAMLNNNPTAIDMIKLLWASIIRGDGGEIPTLDDFIDMCDDYMEQQQLADVTVEALTGKKPRARWWRKNAT